MTLLIEKQVSCFCPWECQDFKTDIKCFPGGRKEEMTYQIISWAQFLQEWLRDLKEGQGAAAVPQCGERSHQRKEGGSRSFRILPRPACLLCFLHCHLGKQPGEASVMSTARSPVRQPLAFWGQASQSVATYNRALFMFYLYCALMNYPFIILQII